MLKESLSYLPFPGGEAPLFSGWREYGCGDNFLFLFSFRVFPISSFYPVSLLGKEGLREILVGRRCS